MHVALPTGKGNVVMGTDALESMGHKVIVGNNIHNSIKADSKEEAKKIHDRLSADGNIEQPLQDAF
jgi:PhnB protein